MDALRNNARKYASCNTAKKKKNARNSKFKGLVFKTEIGKKQFNT